MRLSRVSVTFKEFTERACQVCCIRVWCVQTCNLLIYWGSPLHIKSGLLKWLPALVALFISFQDWLLASAYCCCSVGLPFRNTCMLRARSSSFFLSKCSCLIKFTLSLFIFFTCSRQSKYDGRQLRTQAWHPVLSDTYRWCPQRACSLVATTPSRASSQTTTLPTISTGSGHSTSRRSGNEHGKINISNQAVVCAVSFCIS